jgi:hypothetical protein
MAQQRHQDGTTSISYLSESWSEFAQPVSSLENTVYYHFGGQVFRALLR